MQLALACREQHAMCNAALSRKLVPEDFHAMQVPSRQCCSQPGPQPSWPRSPTSHTPWRAATGRHGCKYDFRAVRWRETITEDSIEGLALGASVHGNCCACMNKAGSDPSVHCRTYESMLYAMRVLEP